MFTLRYELNFFYNTQTNFIIYGRAMLQAVSRWPVTAEVPVRFQVSPREFSTGRKWHRDRFFLRTLGFLCQYHSTNVPYSSSPDVAHMGRANWRNLEIFRKAMFFQKRGKTK